MRAFTILLLLVPLIGAGCSDGQGRTTPKTGKGLDPLVPVIPLTATEAAYGSPARSAQTATFVGRGSCKVCHEYEDRLYQGSDHDLAMDVATEKTVLGDFDDAVYERNGVTSRFFRKDGGFFVNTEGPDGKLHDYEVKYVFGVRPLQQYLIPFPGGRYQTLPLCWDTRAKEEGGQRWFHIYPDEYIPPSDILHWTGENQNWNYMCAECHSTNLEKGYDLATDTYDTTWSEIDVSCEACHGPGSDHVAWAEARTGLAGGEAAAAAGRKEMAPLKGEALIQACARCHSRRTSVWPEYVYGKPFGDAHRLVLLTDIHYFADGQIKDEVYVYGSFLQSRMYHEGVTCTDCHDPHSMKVYAKGNDLCARCHEPKTYDVVEHHFHEPGTEGAACVSCHMPERTYMVVDPRRDHSIRIPRPDLTLSIGTPNACSGCHDDKTPQWSEDAVAKWYGAKRRRPAHFGETLYLAHTGAPEATGALSRLALNQSQPAIARATAIQELSIRPGPAVLRTIESALGDPDPNVRSEAALALQDYPPEERLRAFALLDDPVRLVRVAAIEALAGVRIKELSPEQRAAFSKATVEYVRSELSNSDRTYAHTNIGSLLVRMGQFAAAERSYLTALDMRPGDIIATVNLADLYRMVARDDAGEKVLRAGLAANPGGAPIHHALGLLLVREKRMGEAFTFLERAGELQPDVPRYGYTHAVALHSAGKIEEAIRALEKVHQRHGDDVDVIVALIRFNQEVGKLSSAIHYTGKLIRIRPDDISARQLLRQLRREQQK